MSIAEEILAALRKAPPMPVDELGAWLLDFGFLPEELEIMNANPTTLRAMARELERLATPELPEREYRSLDAWQRITRRGGRVPPELATAAGYEAAARDADREARHWLARLHELGALACMQSATRAADDSMRRAAGALAEAERQQQQGVRHAA